MKERPILFSGAMVLALLAGSKTQTRRAVKLPHQNPLGVWEPTTFGGTDAHGVEHDDQVAIWHTRTGDQLACPYGVPGDRLSVKETFFAWGRWETRYSAKKGRDEWHFVDMTVDSGNGYLYAADGVSDTRAFVKRRGDVVPMYWKRPAIFMPRAASRILLEVTDVRVERLQDISEADAIAEGCITEEVVSGYDGSLIKVPAEIPISAGVSEGWDTARDWYADLWDSINGADAWDANPWVWAVSFKRIEASA